MFIIEGNIGAGKSTFLTMIGQALTDVGVALEPLHHWQKKVYGQSLLANFYHDPRRWSYSFETFAMVCRVREHMREQEIADHTVRLLERSIYSGHYCFVRNGYLNGYMTDLEWEMYQAWFDFLIPQRCRVPQGFIYLRTTPAVAYKRIKKRNRVAEKDLTFDYLKQIHEHHERFLIEKKEILADLLAVPVLVLDCDKEFADDQYEFDQHVRQVKAFIDQQRSTTDHSLINPCDGHPFEKSK
jgi:deoxyadenosine/deoxycytidine kinase